MAVNPRAVSTGEGKGLAKVIKPLESDYYDKKYAEAKERKGEAKKSMAAAMSKTPWKVDMPEFQNKVAELQNFYRDNAYDLMKGDFETQVKLDAMQQDLIRFAEQSKADEKYWNLNDKLLKENLNVYSDASKKSHMDYANMPLEERREYSFREKFDSQKFQKDIREDIAKIQSEKLMPYKSGDMYIQDAVIDDNEVDANVLDLVQAAISRYGEDQVKPYIDSVGGMDKFLKAQRAYAKNDREWKLQSKRYDYDPSAGESGAVFNFNTVPKTVGFNTPLKASDATKMGYNKADVNVEASLPFETSVIFRGKPSDEAIPSSGVFISSYVDPKTKKSTDIGGMVGSGQFFNIDDVRKSLGSNDWVIQDLNLIETFPSGYVVNDADWGGMPIDLASKDTQAFKDKGKSPEMRFYATLKSGENVVREPFYKVRSSVNQQFKSDKDKKAWDTVYKEMVDYVKSRGYEKAYYDLTGKKMPGAKTSNSKEEKKEVSLPKYSSYSSAVQKALTQWSKDNNKTIEEAIAYYEENYK